MDGELNRNRGISLVCDDCRLNIRTADEGWLEWLCHEHGNAYGFRVCHLRPVEDGRKVCQAYNGQRGGHGLHLLALLGDRGVREMVDILVVHSANQISWGRMFVRLWESGLMDNE